VLGTDYPFEMGERDPVGLVGRVPGLAAADQKRILEDNLGRLLAEVRHEGTA